MNAKTPRILMVTAALFLLSMLGGCASIPAPLAGDYPEFQPSQATERSVGARVRWGGQIVDTRPEADRTCIEILARDLDHEFRPMTGDRHHGRFLACRDGFKDPEIFSRGRALTVVGRISGFSEGSIGEFTYRYPLLDADVIYLWADRPDLVLMHDPWFPYHDPWWPYRPWLWHGRSRVSGNIIIRR